MNDAERHLRDEKIIDMLSQGMTLKAVGERFGLQKNSVHHICKRMGFDSRTGLAVRAEKKQEMRDQRFLEKYGLDELNFRRIPPDFRDIILIKMKNGRANAKRRGFEWDIKLCDLVDPSWVRHCPVFGYHWEEKGPYSPSIDRIDSTKGYLPGNVQVICWRANRIKWTATKEEIEKLSNFLNKK